MHIPRKKQNIQNIVNPGRNAAWSTPQRKNCTFSANLTFFCCVKRELSQWRRQDLLVNASKCYRLPNKATKRSFIFFFLLKHNLFSASLQIISNQLIYANKHIATLILSLPLHIQEVGMLNSLSSRSYLDVRHWGINKFFFFFGYRYCSSSLPKPLHSVPM
jgi:hypothetical protein